MPVGPSEAAPIAPSQCEVFFFMSELPVIDKSLHRGQALVET